MYRQGDVLLVPVEVAGVPAGSVAVPPDRAGHVLARGEVTGHAHRVVGTAVRLLTAPDDAEPSYLHVPARARLVHEEHGPVSVPAGWYRVVRQREYVPDGYRPVAD